MEQLAGTLRPADVPDNRIRIMHPTALLGWLGAALSIALPWPQFWRSVVRGRIKGRSATACWQGVAMPIGWITYGLLTGETVQVVTNTVTGVAGLAVLVTVLLKQSELRTGRKLLVSAAGAAGVLTAAAGSAIAGRLTDIGSARAPGNQCRPPLMHGVEDWLAGITGLTWRDEAVAERCTKRFDLRVGDVDVSTIERGDCSRHDSVLPGTRSCPGGSYG